MLEAILLLEVIAILVIVISYSLKIVEDTAKKKRNYREHRFRAWLLFFLLTGVVASLEALIRFGLVEFFSPSPLYWTHLISAMLFYITFVAKGLTASTGLQKLHVAISKPMWFLWSMTGVTALCIGLWNLLMQR